MLVIVVMFKCALPPLWLLTPCFLQYTTFWSIHRLRYHVKCIASCCFTPQPSVLFFPLIFTITFYLISWSFGTDKTVTNIRITNIGIHSQCVAPFGSKNLWGLIIVQQDATVFSLLYLCRQLYMFRVLTPIIRSSYNCNYSFWHWSTAINKIRSY